jgi:glycosyltransferase involved in cell wall biosynthesis
VPFVWTIYGDNSHQPNYFEEMKRKFSQFQEVHFVGFKVDVTGGLEEADYLVQLSDFEGCPYAVLEALQMEVPCILTDFPSAFELVEEGKNGYIVPMNMKGIDIKKIANEIPVFKHKPLSTIKEWETIM